MATIAIMIGGAILNATAFIGGSYIAKSLSGSGNYDAERERHDESLEKYQRDWADYQKKKQQFEAWEYQKLQAKDQATKNFKTTDEELKYYNETHPVFDDNEEPDFSDYYQPNDDKKTGELLYVGGGMLALGYLASKWL